MSNYMFAPSPTFGVSEHTFATWDDGFNKEEIEQIISYCNKIPKEDATIGDGDKDDAIRKTDISWIELNNETQWFYDRVAYIIRQLNGQFFKFNIYGFSEHFQYTVYDEKDEGHYTWHTDSGGSGISYSPRKLSFVLQLSDPSEYEGGDLELFTSAEPTKVEKKQGFAVVFPSYTLHRVTPVTKGNRKTLVVWVCGESFK